MKALSSHHWALVAAAWYFINGLLHTFFVIRAHKGPYDRELLRLLMDGHVLLLSGTLAFICWMMAQNKMQFAGLLGMVTAVFMLIYCAMIFPFLPSMVTIFISCFLLISSIAMFLNFPSWISGTGNTGVD